MDEAEKIAELLGVSLMPWQRQVLEVALEVYPGTRQLVYRQVIVTTPRQAGKTTLVLVLELHRALMWGKRQSILYSAQTGSDGARKLLDDQVPMLEESPLNAAVSKVHRSIGKEGISLKTGSRIDVLASNQSSGHGRTVNLGILDEVFADYDDRREQSVVPAQATIDDALLFIVSTAGTAASSYLKNKVAMGRELVTSERAGSTAYFEWAPEPGMDVKDPATWWACHPALGHTISEAVIQNAFDTMTEGEFCRAFLNMWTSNNERVIPVDVWNEVCHEDVVPDSTKMVLAVDVTPERDWCSVAVCDSKGNAELIEHREGTGWLVDRMTTLAKKYRAVVCIDGGGPAAGYIDDIEAGGVTVEEYKTQDFARACGRLYDAVADGKIQVRRSGYLDHAADVAAKRITGDVWLWSRKNEAGNVCPLIALTLAYDKAVSAGGSKPVWAIWA